jgi:vesicle transport through interaction with t-SNAREs protein 1
MADILDQDAGSELFSSYEAELKLVQADVTQKLDQIPDLTGEPRKAALGAAERSLDEAKEILDQMRIEKQNVPTPSRQKINTRFRNYQSDLDSAQRKLAGLKTAGFGNRYTDTPGDEETDPQLAQRQQLLSGTDRLERSSGRLRDSQRVALETEEIGRNTLADLGRQRETIQHTRDTLLESEGFTDRSIKTLRGMARRFVVSLCTSCRIL